MLRDRQDGYRSNRRSAEACSKRKILFYVVEFNLMAKKITDAQIALQVFSNYSEHGLADYRKRQNGVAGVSPLHNPTLGV